MPSLEGPMMLQDELAREDRDQEPVANTQNQSQHGADGQHHGKGLRITDEEDHEHEPAVT